MAMIIHHSFANFSHWECVTCMKEKFPLHSLDNREVVKESFISNFDCICQNASNYSLGLEEFVFKYHSGDTKREKQLIDEKKNMIDNFLLQPNFKFYQNHDFHKLIKGLKGNKTFSILHTNIYSLQGNFENLQNPINNLDHCFSVISVSEAWTPESKSKQFNSEILEGYQKYYGMKGNSLKSGCRFYVREDIKFKSQNDLNLIFCDEYNKFHCCWIKILNEKNPNILLGVYYRHYKKTHLIFL